MTGDLDDASARAEAVARAVGAAFGIDAASCSPLGSHEDVNVRVVDAGGAEWVAKLAGPATSVGEAAARLAVVDRIGHDDRGGDSGESPSWRVPAVARTPGGDLVAMVDIGDGPRVSSLVEYVPGNLVTRQPVPPAEFPESLGGVVAGMTFRLADVEPRAVAALTGGGPWDLREAPRIVAEARAALGEEAHAVEPALAAAWERVGALAHELPVQAIHGDLTADNVVLRVVPGLAGTSEVGGVIDFGDLGMGWRVAELAVAMTSLLHYDGDAVGLALRAAAACHAASPLTAAEAAALWPLVVARAAVLVASAAVVAAVDPGNTYSSARRPLERLMLRRAVEVGLDEGSLLVREALGLIATPTAGLPSVPAVPSATTAVRVPLGVEAPVHDAGAFASPAAARDALALAAAAAGSGVAFAAYCERRLLPEALTAAVPRSLALGVGLALAAGSELVAPRRATVAVAAADRVVLRFDDGTELILDGIEPSAEAGAELDAGERVGTVAGPAGGIGAVWAQASAVPGATPPRFGDPARADAWSRLCPDPSALLGLPVAAATDDDRDASAVLAVRHDHVAAVQEYYYDAPPRIERGWRHHLFDTNGRGYLDMINNVAIVGHGEPRLADAAAAQWRRLNTNSRFHYAAIADFSARLAARAPEGLDAVFLVNSGSEAVDLALRIARAATGRRGVLALKEAYHGWTVGADAVSTSLGDNPGALGSRPAWVHLLDAPNTYRGTHRGADGHRYLADALSRLETLDARGVSLAGVIAEPIFGNGGGILLPEGYLAGVFDAVRSRGGLAISDEVQVSYGRLGEFFWGFGQQGAVPDIITVAKAMGNGQPLGAVITTRAIAEAFAVEGSFFSSSGGSPVSCVVGAEVLRILDEDGLQENARVVGALLREGLLALAERHPALGAVHGMGLYLGVEVVSGGPDAPDPAAAREICDALLDEGVIVQPTGDHKNVLKIKPPLTIDAAAVERFLAALDRVVTLREARAAL